MQQEYIIAWFIKQLKEEEEEKKKKKEVPGTRTVGSFFFSYMLYKGLIVSVINVMLIMDHTTGRREPLSCLTCSCQKQDTLIIDLENA